MNKPSKSQVEDNTKQAASYPECEKLSKNRDNVDDLMDFLLFLRKKGLHLGVIKENMHGYLEPAMVERGGEVLAAEFLGIDMKKVDKERRELEQSILKD
ncbi:hypothetical protein [Vibrio sp. D431a]|uniref:hypothetical protein n=1 Tax=Vibrio sp. D431a TaxID=2837388 RepID=UPI002555896D|nr:hypothetical protein [Vibrio sp. D431a]MDK9793753.1 hypothetical protein [Vibrio sp. D431a]